MTVSRQRLTGLGWLGAVLFVVPTPVSVWLVATAKPAIPALAGGYLPAVTLFATLSLIGFVFLIVGRETVTST